MFGFEEDLSTCFDYECLQNDNFNISNRKDSFVDLLTCSVGLHDDNLMDLQSISNLELPEVSTQPSETELLEINLDEVFELQYHKKNEKPEANLFEKKENELIGTLTVQQRKDKINKYLQKRKKRTWQKKIYYDCRKRVADTRLRIKGRFVTRTQAIHILGPDHEIFKNL